MRVRFREGDAVVTVAVGAPDVAEAVASLFPHHLVGDDPAEAGGAGWDYRVVAPGEGRAGEGYRLVERAAGDPGGGGAGAAGGVHETLAEALVALELGLLNRLLEPIRGCVHLHGAGALVDGRAVLAVGPSGAGKSSLALAWAAAGHPVLGDDLIPVNAAGRVRALPRLAKIDRSRLAAHGLTDADTVAPVADEPETWVDLHRRAGPPPGWHPVAVVARVELDPALAEDRVEPLAPSALLAHLVESLLDTGLGGERALDVLLPVAEEARGVRLTFGDSARAARTLLHLAGSDPT